MRKRLSAAFLTIFALAPAAMAGEAPLHVVELFTSQGCSSCPPANRFVSEIADNPDQIVLSYGVTYWDYLGWKDTFGTQENTDRQRKYARALGIANVYTPQIILNGSAHSSRYSKNDVESMPLSKDRPAASLSEESGELVIRSGAPSGTALLLVTYKPGLQTVPVKAGENRGRDLQIANVVSDIKTISWSGTEKRTGVTPDPDMAYAAIFQNGETRKIVTAAKYTQ